MSTTETDELVVVPEEFISKEKITSSEGKKRVV
jgi:hypothetical protein